LLKTDNNQADYIDKGHLELTNFPIHEALVP
jgi:hypothetical protein